MPGISLYDYQVNAINKMKNGCILCGGVGSGKSRTALAYYYILNGGKINAKKDFKMTANPPKDLYIITTARKRDTLEWEGELGVFLLSTHEDVNYYKNKVVIDSWNNIKKYADVKDAFFIFDEQRVVGRGAWVKNFLKITKVNNWILLSATPGDNWGDYIPVFLANGFYKNRTQFYNDHVIFSRFTNYPKVDRYVGIRRLVRLRDKILVNMDFDRKTISHDENVSVIYDVQKYKQATKDRWNPYTNEPIVNAAELCYIWRRIVNEDTSRQVALLEIFEKHPKIIVFYNFDYELDILKGLFKDIKVDFALAEWNGHKHQEIPETKSWAYLVQYTAGAEGWNCIKTDTIVFYSQNYSYKVLEQAKGRINRLNTPFVDLYYFHMKSKAPIDIAINRALTNKKKFNEGKFVKW